MNNELSYLIYNTPEEDVSVRAVVKDETIWLTQKAMSELFGCSADNISLHLKNIFSDEELDKNSVIEKISATAADGKKYLTQFYNLDAIISVGYRVNSKKGTQFRIWATQRLREYLVKGYTLNQQRLDKNSNELQQALNLIRKTAQSPELNTNEGRGLIEIISRYTQTFLWLQRYDVQIETFELSVSNKVHNNVYAYLNGDTTFARDDKDSSVQLGLQYQF